MISIVIPALNEEERLGPTLKTVIEYFEQRSLLIEIIVVDDGSRDRTTQVATSHRGVRVIRNNRNLGKGESSRRGVLNSSGDLILLMDADSSTPIHEFDKLVAKIGKSDIVIGSRYLLQSKIITKQPILRRLSSRLFRLMCRRLISFQVSDSQCGFKLFRAKVVQSIFSIPFIGRLSFDAEIICRAKQLGFIVQEVPIQWAHCQGSKIHLLNLIGMYYDLIRFWISHRVHQNS